MRSRRRRGGTRDHQDNWSTDVGVRTAAIGVATSPDAAAGPPERLRDLGIVLCVCVIRVMIRRVREKIFTIHIGRPT